MIIIALLAVKFVSGPGKQPVKAESSVEYKPIIAYTVTSTPTESQPNISQPVQPQAVEFYGTKGEILVLKNSQVEVSAKQITNQAQFFNTTLPSGKVVYYFIVKDQNGIYHAAANACQVCFGNRKGFSQEGQDIVCNNCGKRYPLEKIATEKGGCNPGPINPNIEVVKGKLIITQAELEGVEGLF